MFEERARSLDQEAKKSGQGHKLKFGIPRFVRTREVRMFLRAKKREHTENVCPSPPPPYSSPNTILHMVSE